MENDKVKFLLLDYLNGHLGDEERLRVEKALESDPALRADLQSLRMEVSLLKNSMEDPFEDVHLTNINESVMKEIRSKKVSSISDFSPAWRSYTRAAAALVVIILGVAVFSMFSPGGHLKEQIGNYAGNDDNPDRIDHREENSLQNNKPEIITLSLATSDPKIKIHWIMSSDFEPLSQED